MNILVTGGAGFIGANFVRHLRERHPEDAVAVLDALTYAGDVDRLRDLDVLTVQVNVSDYESVARTLRDVHFDAIVHMAAETHVDRSIFGPRIFAETNAVGTANVCEAARIAKIERVLVVSTDEVYGDLGEDPPRRNDKTGWVANAPAKENALLRPSSPYAASKAAGDLLALAYFRTYDLPVVVTRSTNNYGPWQHPEKFVPAAILAALEDRPIPLYGDGLQRRDWLYVEDHCRALDIALRRGVPGEIYNIGSEQSVPNLAVARRVVEIVGGGSIEHVADRPGHDRTYAVEARKIRDLGWAPECPSLVDGLRETVAWYRKNEAWWRKILDSRGHREWVKENYEKRQ